MKLAKFVVGPTPSQNYPSKKLTGSALTFIIAIIAKKNLRRKVCEMLSSKHRTNHSVFGEISSTSSNSLSEKSRVVRIEQMLMYVVKMAKNSFLN